MGFTSTKTSDQGNTMPRTRLYPEPVSFDVGDDDQDGWPFDDQEPHPDVDYPTVVVEDYPANNNYIVA